MDESVAPLRSSYSKTFERACDAKRVGPEEVLDAVGVPKARFFSALKRSSGPSAVELQKVCDYFDITVDSFLTGFIDRNWISHPTLPEKYLFSAGSKFRTSLVILDYVRVHQGERFLMTLLRNLKVPREFLKTPDQKVSITLLADLVSYLRAWGYSNDDFVRAGNHSVEIRENAEIGKQFQGLSRRAVYERLFEQIILEYEENFDYKIVRAHSDWIEVKASAKAVRVEDFKSQKIDNLQVGFYRQGACAAHLRHAGYAAARSELISSIHLGSRDEVFKIAW